MDAVKPPAPRSFARLHAQWRWVALLECAIAALALWAHTRSLPSMPRGFYKDETSIAYNAYLIATTGKDEFGVSFPLYPQSFNDYKNGGYVYLSVLVMRLFGLSPWTVRLPSLLCWIVGSICLYHFGRRLWPDPWARVFLLIQLGFTPSLLCLSRVGFEVIGLYPALALFLLAIQRGFEDRSPLWAAVGGLAIGASTYMYSTFRLLAPLHCLLVLACYGKREHLARLAIFAGTAALAVTPFALFLSDHGDVLTQRYREIGYLHHDTPLADKLRFFVERYREYFGARYLVLNGDENSRHHTGFGGTLSPTVVLCAAIAIVAIAALPTVRRRRFNWLLLGGLLLAPVSAALTTNTYHSLRAFSLVVFAIPLATYGFLRMRRAASGLVPALVLAVTAIHAAWFAADYFGPYANKSIAAFEYYGQRQAIEKAIRLGATRVVLDSRRRGRHAPLHANFYRVILARRWGDKLPPIGPGKPWNVRPGEFLIFEDPASGFADLREGLPSGALYLAAPYGRDVGRVPKPGQR